VTGSAPQNPLAEMLALWESLPKADRQCEIRVGGAGVTIQRGAMQAVAWSADAGLVQIIYEHALHQKAIERVTPTVAVRLVLERSSGECSV
jgi:hypothetical protein